MSFWTANKWNLVSVSDLCYKLNIMESDYLEWHIERGFAAKPNKEAAHYVLTRLIPSKKEKNMHSHTFLFNPKINKYDVSQLNLEAPSGTSIFQNAFENEMANQNYAKLMNKYEK